MAKAEKQLAIKRVKKEPKPKVDPFTLEGTIILSTKECKVVASTTMFGLIPGQEYLCLRKCFTRTHNRIFEVVLPDGEIRTFGDIWFESVQD